MELCESAPVQTVAVSGSRPAFSGTPSQPRLARLRREIGDARALWKAAGFRGLLRQYGWRLVAIVIGYYLVRDVTLYVLLPFLVGRWLIS